MYPSFIDSGSDCQPLQLILVTNDAEVTCNSPCKIASILTTVAKIVSYQIRAIGKFGLEYISGFRTIHIIGFDPSSPTLTSSPLEKF